MIAIQGGDRKWCTARPKYILLTHVRRKGSKLKQKKNQTGSQRLNAEFSLLNAKMRSFLDAQMRSFFSTLKCGVFFFFFPQRPKAEFSPQRSKAEYFFLIRGTFGHVRGEFSSLCGGGISLVGGGFSQGGALWQVWLLVPLCYLEDNKIKTKIYKI